MHKNRILKLADLVEREAASKKSAKFDMTSWGFHKKAPALNCGTSACMMGLAAISGAFKHQGLRFDILGNDISIRTTKGAWGGISSAVELFGITNTEAADLFYPDATRPNQGKRGARHHAKRLRDFVANGGL
jgi:hypothetical protein